MNSLLRLDAEHAYLDRPVAAHGYASIQREVQDAVQQQEERDLDEAEAALAERNLMDTIRESPIDELAGDVERYRTPFPLFSDLDTTAFFAVVKRLERRVYPAGTTICREGDPGDSLYLVASGLLRVVKDGDAGQQVNLARLGGGSFFGEFGLLTDGRRHATVICVEETELLELHRAVLLELSQEHPSISWTLRTFYQQRVMSMVMATSPLFQAVSAEERKSVLARFTFRRFISGEVIISEGKPGTGFYVILVGSADVSCLGEDGAEVSVGRLCEGHYFGEMSLLSGCVAEATVRAQDVTEVLMLDPQDFYDLAAEHPEVWVVVQEEAERRRASTAQALAEASRVASAESCLI